MAEPTVEIDWSLTTFAGRWRTWNIRVGSHQPPSYVHVSQGMRDYKLDLQTRIAALGAQPGDLMAGNLRLRIAETLAERRRRRGCASTKDSATSTCRCREFPLAVVALDRYASD